MRRRLRAWLQRGCYPCLGWQQAPAANATSMQREVEGRIDQSTQRTDMACELSLLHSLLATQGLTSSVGDAVGRAVKLSLRGLCAQTPPVPSSEEIAQSRGDVKSQANVEVGKLRPNGPQAQQSAGRHRNNWCGRPTWEEAI